MFLDKCCCPGRLRANHSKHPEDPPPDESGDPDDQGGQDLERALLQRPQTGSGRIPGSKSSTLLH